MALAGCLGVFVAADMVSLYALLGLLTLGACGLVLHDDTPRARRAAAVYVGLALAGESLALLGFVMLATLTPGDSLLIRDAAAALPDVAAPRPHARAARRRFRHQGGARAAARVDAARALGGAGSGVLGALRRGGEGRHHRAHPLPAVRCTARRLGQRARRRRHVHRALRRGGRHHAVASEGRARVFEREPDGRRRGRARHGHGGGRQHGAGARRLLRVASRAREGRAFPRRRRGRGDRHGAHDADARARHRARRRPRRLAVHRRRARQVRGQGAARRRRDGHARAWSRRSAPRC